MKIYSVNDPEFKPYGRVVTGLEAAKQRSCRRWQPPRCRKLPTMWPRSLFCRAARMVEVSEHLFGGMPVQLLCNGHNTKLNCLEYHRDSEFNLGTEDSSCCWPRWTTSPMASWTPQRSRLSAHRQAPWWKFTPPPCITHPAMWTRPSFRVLVALPQGTNTAKPEIKADGGDDAQLWACNKWLLAHVESSEAAAGAYVGLEGVNIDIADDL